jgi:hypothetical protein
LGVKFVAPMAEIDLPLGFEPVGLGTQLRNSPAGGSIDGNGLAKPRAARQATG